ncbi:type III pantothenate kinase [bacterium]|nr:type III pantothenate kinase [bacterium]
MIVAIDIGNTTTKFGFFEGKEPVFRLDISPDTDFDMEDYWRPVQESLPPTAVIEGVIICSVVPSLTPILSKLSTQKLGNKPIILDPTAPVGIVNRYCPPGDVGADRLANAFAASKTYGAPVIVVDLGTAITVDAISEDAEYLGGVIAPGVEMAAEALSRRAALLPHVTLEPTEAVLGTDTLSAIRSGLTHGFAAMIVGLVEKVKKELAFPQRTTIVLTGGHVSIFRNLLSELPVTVDPDLTLKGLNLIYWEMSPNTNAE